MAGYYQIGGQGGIRTHSVSNVFDFKSKVSRHCTTCPFQILLYMNYPYAKDVGVSDPINCFVISNKVLCQDRRLIRSLQCYITSRDHNLEHVEVVETPSQVWKTRIMPLYYTCTKGRTRMVTLHRHNSTRVVFCY